jgi:hypothetical protein
MLKARILIRGKTAALKEARPFALLIERRKKNLSDRNVSTIQ